MRYDLDFLQAFCLEIGLAAQRPGGDVLDVDLGGGAILTFLNAECDADCLMGFSGTPWHTHGGMMFHDPRGNYIEVDVLGLLCGLKDGQVLICERAMNGRLVDRELIHGKFNVELSDMLAGEQLAIRRAETLSGEVASTVNKSHHL